MEKLVIEGGVPLSGTVVPAGNKNAALPLLAACLLTDEQIVLENVPQIRDTEALMVLLEDLGVKVDRRDGNVVALQADAVTKTDVDPDLAETIRASFLVACPLTARFGGVPLKRNPKAVITDLPTARKKPTRSELVKRLLADGLVVESKRRPAAAIDDERRRYYRLTPFGRGVVTAETARLEAMVAAARSTLTLRKESA